MASTQYNDWKKWKIIPIQSIKFYFDNNNDYTFSTLESGSSFSIEFLEEENDSGGTDIQMLIINTQVIVVQNDYGNMYSFFNDVHKQKCINFTLLLKSNPGQPNGGEIYIHPAEYIIGNEPLETLPKFMSYNVKYNIRQSEVTPRLYITAQALISMDAYELINGGIIIVQSGD